MAKKLGACIVKDCEKVLCSRDVGAVAGDNSMAVEEDAVSAAKEIVEKTVINDGPEESANRGRG